MAQAQATQFVDDERIRVTQWRFAARGDATGVHVHEFDYVVIPVTGGELAVDPGDGTTGSRVQVSGTPYSGHAGTRHNVISAGDEPIVFVEVELKTH